MFLAGNEHAGKLTSEETHTMTTTGWKAYLNYAKFCGGYFIMAMLLLLVLLFTLSRLSTGIWLQIWLDQGDGLEVSSSSVCPSNTSSEWLPAPWLSSCQHLDVAFALCARLLQMVPSRVPQMILTFQIQQLWAG